VSVFDYGLPVIATNWIHDGILSALVQTRHSSRLTGLAVTPYIDNLILHGSAGGHTLAEMISGTRRGLLLTCLWYISEVNPRTLLLTGVTRDGVFLVERGEIVGAVNNFRFSESPLDLLRRIAEIGVTERTLARQWRDYFPRTAMPGLRIDDFHMSAASLAS
jgi:predicted Zn-dependent protease